MMGKIVHVLCEGQTEQGFVDSVLKPYLMSHGITAVKSIIVTTNRKESVQGGTSTYLRVKNDLVTMTSTWKNGDFEKHVFTSMFDLYALPNDFPGYDYACHNADKYARVALLEKAMAQDLGDNRFIPYIQLHEFEALVFCGTEHLVDLYPESEKQIVGLKAVLDDIGNPELINDKPETAPSKRIINAIEGLPKKRYSYNKPKAGKHVTSLVGVDALRAKCPHFDEWVGKLLG